MFINPTTLRVRLRMHRARVLRPMRSVLFDAPAPRRATLLAGVIAFFLPVGVFLWESQDRATSGRAAAGQSSVVTPAARLPDLTTRRFLGHMATRLPQYRPLFRAAEERHGIPWRLLASQSYQESYWDPRAKSPTGVRGLMMLTRTTAAELGIQNRLDPAQSIRGGARYLAHLRKRLPSSIEDPHRTWIALAAYDVGLGHIKDARVLAVRMGKNPDLWPDLESVLPLLSQKKYYRTLRHGYARGKEPVQYVQRIQRYHSLMERHHP